jgi:predicted ATP-grasp superfamily ATP-dependent carboligase
MKIFTNLNKAVILIRLMHFVNEKLLSWKIDLIETDEFKKAPNDIEKITNPFQIKVTETIIKPSKGIGGDFFYENKYYDFDEYFRSLPEIYLFIKEKGR